MAERSNFVISLILEILSVVQLLASQEAGHQFELFWATDMQMFLQTGHLMPIAEGFACYWRRLRSETGESIVPEHDLALGMLRSPNTVEGRLTAGLPQQNQNLERTQWE